MNNKRCPNCGAPLASAAVRCQVCGTQLSHTTPVPITPGKPSPVTNQAPPPEAQISGEIISTEIPPSTGYDLVGTVLSVSNLRYEPADFNIYRFFSIAIIIFWLLPLLLVYIVFRIMLAILLRLGGFRPGMSLFGHIFWIFIGRGAHGGGREVPVMTVVVRTPTGENRTVRIKGHLVRGSIQSGDRVAMNGRWEGGTLLFRQGMNMTTRSELRLRPNYWKPVLVILLGLSVAFVIYVMNQTPPRF